MTCAGMFLFLIAIFLATTLCQGNGSCPRNDCTIPETSDRQEIKCSLRYEDRECFPLDVVSGNSFPPMPENLDVKIYKVDGRREFNITWQPGRPKSSEFGDLQYLQSYQIDITEFGDNRDTACYKMDFTNWPQLFNKDKDENLTLYSDCLSGFNGGIMADTDYSVAVTSLPVPMSPSTRLETRIVIGKCKSFSVPNGNVAPSDLDFYEGDIVKVTCIEKYKLEGHSSRQCLNSGWNHPEPKCISIIDIKIFTNNSVFVNYTNFQRCSKYRVRLTNKSTGPAKYAFDTDEPMKMYDHVDYGRWNACVKCSYSSQSDEICSSEFDISDHTPAPTAITTTSSSTTATPTNSKSTIIPSATSEGLEIDQPTSSPSQSNMKSILYRFYAVAGCAIGIILIAIIFLLRRRQYKSHQSPLRDSEESRNLTDSNRSSSADENNVDIGTGSDLTCNAPQVDPSDDITIYSGLFHGVPLSTPAQVSV